MTEIDSQKPWGLGWRSNTLFILATVGIGLFTDLFLYGLIVPILPFILEDRLGTPQSQIQSQTSLLLACYAGASVVFSLPAGIIADKLPARRLPFLVGLAALFGATIMLFLGRSLAVLVIARVLQGISAAVVWTIGLAMILDTVGSEKLGVTIGSIFSFISVGELAAPILGGVVYEKARYGGVFGMGFGILGLDFLMRLVVIEKKTAVKYELTKAHDDEDEDVEAASEVGESEPLLSNTKREEEEWKITKAQPRIIRNFPILYCLRNPRLLTAEAVAFMQATLLAVFDATIPTEAQTLFHFNALKAGLLFSPLVLPYLLLGPLAGKGVDKYGPKFAAAGGMLYLILPLLLLRIPKEGGTSEIVKFCIFEAMCGLGLAFISAPSIVEASYVAEKYHKANKEFFGEEGPYAQLYAINSMVFSMGLTLGPLIAGTLRDSIGYGNMNAVVAGLCLVVSILSFFFLGGKPFRRNSR
ncbi:vesicular amine transporter [Phlyctema vagabunda]|uniref:Vesicular amine transporter n=1 Tax=Phlyctema vagabunda TaxID=108571 RepID=A0ABR4PNU8_9HELO